MDTKARLSRYFPDGNILVSPHENAQFPEPSPPRQINHDDPLRVVILGALGIFKGADRLAELASMARARGLPLEFHLLGYAYRKLPTVPFSKLKVHGEYEEEDLDGLLDDLAPDIAWFPGSCPETYSYTLSACMQRGLPILAPNIGAFPERLAGRRWTWLFDANLGKDDMAASFASIREALIAQNEPEPIETVLELQESGSQPLLPELSSAGQQSPGIDWPEFHDTLLQLEKSAGQRTPDKQQNRWLQRLKLIFGASKPTDGK